MENQDQIREALEQALQDVQVESTPMTPVREFLPRVDVAETRKPAPTSLIKGRYERSSGQCVQCGTVQAQHGNKCSADEYKAYREVLMAACLAGSPAPEVDYVAKRQAEGWQGTTQGAARLAR